MAGLSETLGEGLRLTARSWAAGRRLWAGLLLGAVAVCLLAVWVGARIGDDPAYLYGEFREDGFYGGFMTAASAFCFGAAGMALLPVAIALRRRAESARLALPWVVGAAGLIALGADDLLLMHEILSYRLDTMGVPRPLGLPFDRLVIVAYGLGALLVLGRASDTLRVHWQPVFPLVLALALLVASEVLDLILGGMPVGGTVLAPADRVLKTLGAFMLLVFAQALVVSVATNGSRAGGRGSGSGGTPLPHP